MVSKTLINDEIDSSELRVISETGEQLGILSLTNAKAKARIDHLDLVLVSPDAKPPVAKILDYGRFKYEQSKKNKEKAKKDRANRVEVKEINLRPNTDIGDLSRLQGRAAEWLGSGSKVKVNMILRGRENKNKKPGIEALTTFIDGVSMGKIEGSVREYGRGVYAILTN